MDVSEGEPPLKRRHHKRPLVAESNVVCGLTHHQWFDLILQRLLLEDLIAVKRTCKTFATFKRLRSLIKDKEYTAFDGVDKKFWNRRAQYREFNVVDAFFAPTSSQPVDIVLKHCDKYLLYSEHEQGNSNWKSFLGIYSNKRKLWIAFCNAKKAACEAFTYSFPFEYLVADLRTISGKKVRIYMTGFTRDEFEAIENNKTHKY